MKHAIHNVQRAIFGAVHIDNKATYTLLKGESREEGKIFSRVFLNRYEDRLCSFARFVLFFFKQMSGSTSI